MFAREEIGREMEDDVSVRVERSGAVTTVILDRPRVRNAVDGVTAAALASAGMWQIDIRVPEGLPAGIAPIQLCSGADCSVADTVIEITSK